MTHKLSDDQMCFGCGHKNAKGLHLKFTVDEAKRQIQTRWVPAKESQGYADVVHGGMIGLVLDELMVNLLWKMKWPSVTAQMEIRFLNPARVGEPIDCQARLVRHKGRLYEMEALGTGPNGQVIAKATAKCVRV